MSDTFDPYHKWLGIPPAHQPADHYRLLGIEQFEGDTDVISLAADQRMTFLRTFQSGEQSELSQRLLNEVATAKICLLNATEKARYDAELARKTPPDTPPPLPAGDDSQGAFAVGSQTDSASSRSRGPTQDKAGLRKKKSQVPVVGIAVVILLVIVLVGLILWGKEKKGSKQIGRTATAQRKETSTKPSQPAEKPKDEGLRIPEFAEPRKKTSTKPSRNSRAKPVAGFATVTKTTATKTTPPSPAAPNAPQGSARKRQLAAAEEELHAQGLVENDDAQWEPEELGKAYRELSAPKESASERELWRQILELQKLREELGKDLATRQQNSSIQENLEILDTTLAPVPELPNADWVKTTAEAYLTNKKVGLRKLPEGLWEPKLADSCRTLQAEVVAENNRYRTTFNQAIEAQKAKWQKEFNKVAQDPFNPEYIRLGKLLPHSQPANVNGNSNKPPHPEKVILKMAKKEMRKDPKFKEDMAKIQTAFEEKNSRLKSDEKQLQNRYKKIPKDKNIRLALQILDQGLAPDLPESDPLVLATDPSSPNHVRNPPPPRVKRKQSVTLSKGSANDRDFERNFAENNGKWRPIEEQLLTEQLDRIKSKVVQHKAAVKDQIENSKKIQVLQVQLNKAGNFSPEKRRALAPMIKRATRELQMLKADRNKTTAATNHVAAMLKSTRQQIERVEAMTQKYNGYTYREETPIEIKTNVKKLTTAIDKLTASFAKIKTQLKRANQ